MMFLLYTIACSSNTTIKIDIPDDDTGTLSWTWMKMDISHWNLEEMTATTIDPQIHVNAEEVCDEQDNNCDGDVDEGLLNKYYIDQDNDGFGLDDETMKVLQPHRWIC